MKHVAEERELPVLLDDVEPGSGRRDGGRRRVAIDAHEETCLAALDLHRLRLTLGSRDDLACIQALEHPANRRLAVGGSIQVDGSGDDQPVDRPSHRDVVEA